MPKNLIQKPPTVSSLHITQGEGVGLKKLSHDFTPPNNRSLVGILSSVNVVGQNEIQVKMKFLCLSTLIIHGS